MSSRHINRRDETSYFRLDASGANSDPPYYPWTHPNEFSFHLVEGNIINTIEENDGYDAVHKKAVHSVRRNVSQLEMSEGFNLAPVWRGCGLSVEAAREILRTRLIRRIAGEAFDPTMFLKDFDDNLSLVVRRARQAIDFLSNLRNPRKLARLTLRYFKGKETRRSLTRRYFNARKAFSRRIPPSGWKSAKVSSAYLEYQFGWRPLCDDIATALKLSHSLRTRSRIHSAIVGLQPRIAEAYGPVNTTIISGMKVHAEVAGHAAIRWEISHPWLRRATAYAPPEYALWDSIPFSWLVDVLTNVGDHLKYGHYHLGLSLVGGYLSVKRNVFSSLPADHTRSGSSPNGSTYSIREHGNGPLWRREVTTSRQVINDWPTLPWVNRVPSILPNTELLSVLAAFGHTVLDRAFFSRAWTRYI